MEKAISQLQTNSGSQLNTVNKKIEGFTKKQVKGSQEARRLYHQSRAQNMENINIYIHHNLIKNCPVTTEDVNMANIMFGPDILMLKGQYTRNKPVQVIDDSIDIPK